MAIERQQGMPRQLSGAVAVDIAAAEGPDAGSRKDSTAGSGSVGGSEPRDSEPRGSSPEAGASEGERQDEERPRRGFPFLQVAEVGSRSALSSPTVPMLGQELFAEQCSAKHSFRLRCLPKYAE
jgi:hypothetical protein